MKSYFKFLSRNKLYTLINVAGLVVSLMFIIQMHLLPLLLSLLNVLAVNVLTAAFQGWCAATENPVNSIKNE